MNNEDIPLFKYKLYIAELDENHKPILDNENNIKYILKGTYNKHKDILNIVKENVYPNCTINVIRNLISNKNIGHIKYNLIKIEKLYTITKNSTHVSKRKNYNYTKDFFKLYINDNLNDPEEKIIWIDKGDFKTLNQICNYVKDIEQFKDLTPHKIELMRYKNKNDKFGEDIRTSKKYKNLIIVKL